MSQKIYSLDGLRGLAAFSVIISHLFFAFYPYLHTGTGAVSPSGFEKVIFHSPASFFYKGNFAVAIFFVISGVVLSRSFFLHYSVEKLQSAAAKRYIRLGGPVFAIVMLSYLLMVLNLYPAREGAIGGWLASFLNTPASFFGALKEGLFGAMVFRQISYNPVLWTIQVELIGSFLLFAYLALFGRQRYLWVFSTVLCALLIGGMNIIGIYLSLFIVGAHINRAGPMKYPAFFVPVCLFVALYLGGYHVRSEGYTSLVQIAVWINANTWFVFLWTVFLPCVGACILVYVVTQSHMLDRLFSVPLFRWLGKVSYALYLIHLLVLSSIGAYIYIWLSAGHPHYLASLGCGLVVIVVSCVTAELFYRYVDKPSIYKAAQFSAWLEARNQSASPKL